MASQFLILQYVYNLHLENEFVIKTDQASSPLSSTVIRQGPNLSSLVSLKLIVDSSVDNIYILLNL